MGSLDTKVLCKRLQKCGRLPGVLDAVDEVVLRTWLGDYEGAYVRCHSAPQRKALEDLTAAMPTAEMASMTFFPRQATSRKNIEYSGPVSVIDGFYKASDGTDVGFMYMGVPASGRTELPEAPTVIVRWGGNAELAALFVKSRFLELVTKHPIHIFFVDYRGYGWSGGLPSLATLRSDADAFFAALPSLASSLGIAKPELQRVVVMGRSLGAHCALHAAVLHAGMIHALILDSPASCHWPMEQLPASLWTSLSSAFPSLEHVNRTFSVCQCCPSATEALPGRLSMWLDPLDLACCIHVPTIVISGTMDCLCPQSQVQALFDNMASPDKQLVWIDGAGHNDVSASLKYWQTMMCFLTRPAENQEGV